MPHPTSFPPLPPYREIILPIAAHLGIPPENVIANRMMWEWDHETEEPSRLVGFDRSELTAQNQGKPQVIARIRQRYPYASVGGWCLLCLASHGCARKQSVYMDCMLAASSF